ncbi:MAG TPA: helix-turn-helix domain-containing protein [Spirochaetota bacterium]|nr:helix-turn-helix domain-containing protein [Spirochaetota bacterium]HQE58808.1 helix-turn-helix domain-containing protein [Spirochaetota bacterium]
MSRFSIIPVAPLSVYVDRIWGWTEEDELPDILPGTGCELFFYDNPPSLISEESKLKLPKFHSGCTRYSGIKLSCDSKISFIAVRFRSSAFRHFIPMNISELTDNIFSGEELWDSFGNKFADEVFSSGRIEDRVDAIQKNLMMLLSIYKKKDEWLDEFISGIYYADENFSLSDYCGNCSLSFRQIERLVNSAVGVPPKYFHRTARFQRALRSLLLTHSKSYLPAVYDGGYYDQSHFIRDFRYYTGKTPGEFLTDKHFMSHFYNTSRSDRIILP